MLNNEKIKKKANEFYIFNHIVVGEFSKSLYNLQLTLTPIFLKY